MSYRVQRIGQRSAAGLASLALLIQPQLLVAGELAPIQPQRNNVSPAPVERSVVRNSSTDVVLSEGGVLVGRVVDTQGNPLRMAPVTLSTGGKQIATLHTNKSGTFRVASLKGGVYQVASPGHQGVYRFWAAQTAPPVAQRGLNLVSGGDVVRGQFGPPAPGNMFTRMGQTIAEHPIITAGVVATAIAVPLALEDDDDVPVEP